MALVDSKKSDINSPVTKQMRFKKSRQLTRPLSKSKIDPAKMLLFALLTIAFSHPAAAQQKFSVTVQLAGFKDSTEFFLMNKESTRQIDSSYLKNGRLTFRGQVTDPAPFRLAPKLDKEFLYFDFWVENKPIRITGSKDSFSILRVSGSPLSEIYLAIEAKHAELYELRNRLANTAFNEKNENKANGIWGAILALDQWMRMNRIQAIVSFPPSLVTMEELFWLRNDLSIDSLGLLFRKFTPELQQSKYGAIIAEYFTAAHLGAGSTAADLHAKTLDGKEIKLSDYRGKLVLLDFWASWCGPCRFSNKDLVPLYKKYNASGFEILSFSLDTNPDSWRKASEKDGVTWTNISELKGYYSKQIASYHVEGIPKSFLIDKEGTIVKVFNGYSEENKNLLEKRIQELIK